jgi:hypothetical protein
MVRNVNIADMSVFRITKINMVANKHYAWGTCKNDSRYPQFWTKNEKNDSIFSYAFLHPTDHLRSESGGFECKKDHYIYSLHFVGENGPTKEYPDPLSAVTSEENLCWFVVQIYYLPHSFCGFKHI